MGFFENRRKQKEIERLENELRIITNKIDYLNNERDKLREEYKRIDKERSKVYVEEFEIIKREYEDNIAMQFNKIYVNCLQLLYSPFELGINLRADCDNIVSLIADSFPRTAKLTSQLIVLAEKYNILHKEIGMFGHSSYLYTQKEDLERQIEQLKRS